MRLSNYALLAQTKMFHVKHFLETPITTMCVTDVIKNVSCETFPIIVVEIVPVASCGLLCLSMPRFPVSSRGQFCRLLL